MVTHHISPTNLGLSLTAQLAAHDFGFVNLQELSNGVERILHSLDDMPRYRGHFFNWYNTATRRPLSPQYVSSVDSGNLAASLAALLPEIEQAYGSLLDSKLGITRAEVSTGEELGAAERAELVGALERMIGGKVEAQYRVNPVMIGGARVRVGSTIYDGSVRAQLDRLRAQLISE